jgi:hypothetical protein
MSYGQSRLLRALGHPSADGRNAKLILSNHFYAVNTSCRKPLGHPLTPTTRLSSLSAYSARNERIVGRWCQPIGHISRYTERFSTKFGTVIVNPLKPLSNEEVLFCSLPTDTQNSATLLEGPLPSAASPLASVIPQRR